MQFQLAHAIDGFLLSKQIQGCSPHTIRNYTLTLRRFTQFLGADTPITDIGTDHVKEFLHHLQTTQVAPSGVAPRPARRLSPKSIANVHTDLSSFWTWLVDEGLADEHIIRAVVAPPAHSRASIDPFSRDEIRALLDAVDFSAPWGSRPNTRNARPQELRLRDRAMLLFLLDTGVRASELCALSIADVNRRTGAVTVTGKSRLDSGQGKQRIVHTGDGTRKALWRYLVPRISDPEAPLFAASDGQRLDRRHLATHLRRLGKRAGVAHVHPHRFRHTFAIAYIRNGGDAYTLQSLLGHSSLDMVKRYLKIARTDCQTAHRRAGPVDNWSL